MARDRIRRHTAGQVIEWKHPKSPAGEGRDHAVVCRLCTAPTWNVCGCCNDHCDCETWDASATAWSSNTLYRVARHAVTVRTRMREEYETTGSLDRACRIATLEIALTTEVWSDLGNPVDILRIVHLTRAVAAEYQRLRARAVAAALQPLQAAATAGGRWPA